MSQGLGRFKPYPEYKDSGVKWVGRIPTDWNATRLKHLCIRSALYGANEASLAYTTEGIRFLRTTDITDDGSLVAEDAVFLPRHLVEEYILRDGDLLFSRSGTLGRALHYRHALHGECAYAGYLVRFEPSARLNSQFAFFFTKSSAFAQWLSVSTIYSTIGNVNGQKYANLVLPTPPLREQAAIAAFLHRETARIDALIAKKERLIELLQEKRSALITHAVTKGLNPAAPMKDSGDEFLGATPCHWLCVVLSRVTLSRCDGPFGSGLKSEHYRSSGVRVVRLQNIGTGEFVDTDHAYIEETHARELGNHSVLADDVLVAGLGDDSHPVGRACVAPPGIHPAMVKADCFRFRVNRKLVFPHFIAHQLTATAVLAAGSLATGATRARMNLTATSQRRLALPPIDEQAVIAKFVDAADAQCSALVDVIRLGINRLNEYRTAFISAAVTGKIDIRTEVA